MGSPAQFLIFSGVLNLSARLLGGRGDLKTLSYLMALFWVPLMIASGVAELIPGVGARLGLLIRSYALVLCVPALAAADSLSLGRALVALLLPAACGILLGLAVLTLAWPAIQPLLSR